MIISTDEGKVKLANFIDTQKMYNLYEKFILEYYKKHYPELKPQASHIDWDVNGIDDYLPIMKSDITLEFDNKILIIDAKYYQWSMTSSYYSNKKTYISQNIYQIFTYVKNKQAHYDKQVDGMLLYAETDNNFNPDSTYNMGGNNISLKSLNLNSDFNVIQKQLDDIANQYIMT
jgi:5-methylcytosine-specific restriction enzyme subunit McrC